ncbi:24626_t:CDS:1, partial [Dentiscutata erythropus]
IKMSSTNNKNNKYLYKCNYCLEKNKDGYWLAKATYNLHLRRQRHFQQINTRINDCTNPLLLNNDENN